ncbi:MAG TPA: ComEC/Rec2 family competence protein [Pyrinomonadaceae bacterium]|jgi:competence protein ComEC|nr:ComEC/Rec2 family competence protein [Pyrinomonadaceae bacterium]
MPDRFYMQSRAVDHTQGFAAYPLAQLAAAFAVGILGALYFVVAPSFLIGIAAFTTVLAVVALVINTRSRIRNADVTKKLSVPTLLVTLAVLFLGATLASIERFEVPANQIKRLINEGAIAVGEPLELTGVLEHDPEIAPERSYLQLRVQRIRSRVINRQAEAPQSEPVERDASGVVMLLAAVPTKSIAQEFDQLDLRYGARISVMTLLERADDFRNPGVSSFTEYLDRKGYDASGFVKSPLLIQRLDNERVFLPLAWLYEWRRRLQTEIDARFSNETAGVLDAALLGNRYNLSRATSERFREGGTFHVLVISGLHITFLGGLVFLIARRFTKKRALQFLLSAAMLWAYSLAVGAESSVVRAALMFTVVLLAPLVSRRAASLNALGGASLVLLVWRPTDLFDPSFQLTFVSVLAIVIFAWPLLQKMSEIGSWRPTRETPYPPSCATWLRSLCESLFWSERDAQRELERTNYSYNLFKLPLAGKLERIHLQRPLRYVFGALVVSAGVQVALLPFLVVYFHRLSFASFLLNIGVSLMMAGVAILGAGALLIAQFSTALAAPLIGLTNGLNWTMVHSVDPFARVGVASIRLPEYAGWAAVIYGLYYLPLGTLAVALMRWRPLQLSGVATQRRTGIPACPGQTGKSVLRRIVRLAVAAQLFAIAFVVIHPFSAGRPHGKLRIDFLDVGQGDSALITFPDNTTLLIDGGGRPGPFQQNRITAEADGEETFDRETRSVGEAVVSEYLWWRGLDHVDYILATHADADHIDGLNDVARNFQVRAALVARTPEQDPEYARFSDTLIKQQIPLRIIGAGDVLRFGDVTATVLSPLPLANPNAPSRNNDSIVLRLQFGRRAMLLTGDIEMSGEERLLRANENLRVDVVKVAHHGSKTSSIAPLIAATQPRFAVISVGQTSIFGHPSPDVVERWKIAGAQVLTTGNRGTITVMTDGYDLKLETFVKPQ